MRHPLQLSPAFGDVYRTDFHARLADHRVGPDVLCRRHGVGAAKDERRMRRTLDSSLRFAAFGMTGVGGCVRNHYGLVRPHKGDENWDASSRSAGCRGLDSGLRRNDGMGASHRLFSG